MLASFSTKKISDIYWGILDYLTDIPIIGNVLEWIFIIGYLGFIPGIIIYLKENINYKKYKKMVAENKANIDFNEKTYPNLQKEYERKKAIYDKKYAELFNEYKTNFDQEKISMRKQLRKVNEGIEELEGIISPNYYEDLDSIIQIIDNGRADSLKEAINVFEADVKAQQLVDIQKQRLAEERSFRREEKNRILEEKRRQEMDGYYQCIHCQRYRNGLDRCPISDNNTGNCNSYIPN